MRDLFLLPSQGIPPSGYPTSCELEWFLGDTAKAYQARGGHPFYSEHDVLYRLNSLGYRCPEFDLYSDIRIVTVGCSYVFGTGLPNEALFHTRFSTHLESKTARPTVLWNLGAVGTSNDYIFRILCLAVKALNPHIVLVNFTHISRREYISADNCRVNYTPLMTSDDPVVADILEHFRALSSKRDDLLNFFRNYKAVEALLAGHFWLFSVQDPERLRPLFGHLELSRYCGQLPSLDTARDHLHPGPRSHEALFQAYWDRFVALGGLTGL